ncbi:hypothetical protein BDW68DRAFT_56073 [Aspergillus falconensis]
MTGLAQQWHRLLYMLLGVGFRIMVDWNAQVRAPNTTHRTRSHGELEGLGGSETLRWRTDTGLVTCIAGSIVNGHRPAVTSVGLGVDGEASRGLPANAVDFVLNSIGRQTIWLGKVDFQACAGRRTEI